MAISLTPGSACYAHGNTYQIDGQCSPTEVNARDWITGGMVVLKIKDLQAPPAARKLDRTLVPADQWRRATELAADLYPLRGQQRVPRATQRALAAKHGLSARQLQRYRDRFDKDPRASALVPKQRGRGKGARVLDAAREDIIAHAIEKFYHVRERPPKEYVVTRVGALCRRLHLVPPDRKSIVARIRAQEGMADSRARLGPKAAKQKWEVRVGGLTVQRPLELVQIDHTRVDVHVISNDRLRVLGRPWITLAIDVATRCVVGYYLAMHAPSSVSVALCVEHMVLPKPENEQDAGIWPMYGKPRTILVDNGKDLRAYAFTTGCQEHGIELKWRPVKTPHYGAHIERLNGTLMGLVHLLRGTTFSNSKQRGDYPSEARAVMTLDELRAWLVQKICRFYHVRAHSGLGASPLHAWEQHQEQGGWHPDAVANPEAFRLDFLPRAFRRLHRTGLELNGSRYWDSALSPWAGRSEDVEVRYHPGHTERVWVRHPDGGFIEAYVIAGRAMPSSNEVPSMDAPTRERMIDLHDLGLEVCDAIEAKAATETRDARKGKRAPTKVTPHAAVEAPTAQPSPPITIPAAPFVHTRPLTVEIWE